MTQASWPWHIPTPPPSRSSVSSSGQWSTTECYGTEYLTWVPLFLAPPWPSTRSLGRRQSSQFQKEQD